MARVRSHGWSGNTPASDEEAIDRILDAADEIIAQRGSAMRIADVARSLGVTRQTVYRYFPGTEALLVATAMRSADGFLEQLAAHVRGETDPVSALVEGMAFAIEALGEDSQIGLLLSRRQHGGSTISITSDTALTFSRAMLHRFDVDWEKQAVVVVVLKEHTYWLDYKQWTAKDGVGELVFHWDGIEPDYGDRFPALMYRFDKKGLTKVVVKCETTNKVLGEIPCP